MTRPLALALAVTTTGCIYHLMPVDVPTGQSALQWTARRDEPLLVRITRPDGEVIVGELIGLDDEKAEVLIESFFPRSVPLTEETRLEVRKFDGGRLAMWILIVAAGAAAIFAPTLASLTLSCPMVEIPNADGSLTVIGELGGGTLFPALEAPDRLALPPLAPGPFTFHVARDPAETDHLDAVHLDLVEVPAGRAVPTPDHRLLLLGAPTALAATWTGAGPRTDRGSAARDAAGGRVAGADGRADEGREGTEADFTSAGGPRDVTADLAAPDHRGASTAPDDLLTPGLDVLTADLPPGADHAVLLRLAGGPLPEQALQRLWTALGPRAQQDMAAWASDPARADEARAWRVQAGLDLHVEVRRHGTWETTAAIPSPGWIGARELAVPLPADADRLRLTAARGVFVLDHLAVAPILDPAPTVHRLAPTAATVDGDDVRDLLAASDDRRLDLTPGRDRLTLTFDVPDLSVPTAAFAAAEVHYVPLPTDPGDAEPGLARWMRGHPERFTSLIAAEAAALRAVADAR